MIQRKQSLWLLIAALLNGGVYFFDLYISKSAVTGTEMATSLRVSDHYPTLIIVLVMALVPFITIFMYADRKRQIRMAAMSLLATTSFITMTLMRVSNFTHTAPPGAAGSYGIGSILPIAGIIFIIMAILGIRSDDKMVKSADRLR